jgi:hypothetical protein
VIGPVVAAVHVNVTANVRVAEAVDDAAQRPARELRPSIVALEPAYPGPAARAAAALRGDRHMRWPRHAASPRRQIDHGSDHVGVHDLAHGHDDGGAP